MPINGILFFKNKILIYKDKYLLIFDKYNDKINSNQITNEVLSMEQKSTLFLRIAIFAIGVPILALCIFLLPDIAAIAWEEMVKGGTLGYIVMGIIVIMYVSAIPFYMALFQALKLLNFIDKNQAFSQLSVNALKKIKFCALTISGLYTLALPLIYVVARWDDAPGLIVIGLVIAGAALVIAIFAALLQRLLQEAINIKMENDLTI